MFICINIFYVLCQLIYNKYQFCSDLYTELVKDDCSTLLTVKLEELHKKKKKKKKTLMNCNLVFLSIFVQIEIDKKVKYSYSAKTLNLMSKKRLHI